MTLRHDERTLSCWIKKHSLDPATFVPKVWTMLRNNLSTLKNVSGLTQEQIARKIGEIPDDMKVSGSRRVKVAQIISVSQNIKELEEIARACGFDPLLLVMPDLRECLRNLLQPLTENLQFETSVFRTLRCCKPPCDYINRDPDARYCSQCGKKIED